ncbi:MAG: OadG family protein [Lachnospiraceae bacterium]|nr:OadG family protein [Lachnospiraceae bacterium]
MKNRLKALLLATGLTVSMLCAGASAQEAATESGAAAEVQTEAETSASSETEAAAAEDGAGNHADYYDEMKASVAKLIEDLSYMTDAQLQTYMEGTDESSAKIAAQWMNVKEELGSFVEIGEQTIEEDGNVITITSDVKYDQVPDKTKVSVTYTADMKANTVDMNWDIAYPMSKLLKEAGLNTLMGIGIVFLTLLFLSFIISRFTLVSGLGQKKAETKTAPPVVQAAAPEAAEEEEELSDDGELVAVIAAAIAASENTGTDGFVVRSIKKANRKKWLNA